MMHANAVGSTLQNSTAKPIISQALDISANDTGSAVLGWTDPEDPYFGLFQWFINLIKMITKWWDVKSDSEKILTVAKELVMPAGTINDGDKSKSKATESYQDTAYDIWKYAGYDTSENSTMWSDCGGFVGVVMKTVGADPSFPILGANTQANYVMSSSKYSYNVIAENTETERAKIKKGDLLYIMNLSNTSKGHAMIAASNSGTSIYTASMGYQVPNTRGDIRYWGFTLYTNYKLIAARLK